MADSREAERRPVRGPLRPRSRQRWAIAGGAAACWLLLEFMTGSVVTSTIVLVVIAGIGVACVAGLRGMGITRDHPWFRGWPPGRGATGGTCCTLPPATCPMSSSSPRTGPCTRRTLSNCG